MKKLTTTMMQRTLNKQDRRLTVGLDLGDPQLHKNGLTPTGLLMEGQCAHRGAIGLCSGWIVGNPHLTGLGRSSCDPPGPM